jgi:hypothetical protein
VSLGLLGGYLLWYPSVRQAHEFFRAITNPSRQQLPRRAVAVPAGLPLLAALDKLTWDTRCQFRLPNRWVVEEAALVAHLLAHGPGGTLEDVVRLQSSSCLSKK